MNQLTSELNRIGNTTEFNTQKLLRGGAQITGEIGSVTNVEGEAATPGTKGYTEFEITTVLQAGDTIKVAGETITVYATEQDRGGDAFGISLELAETAEDQAAAIRNMTFDGLTLSGSGAQVTITQQVPGIGDVTGPELGSVMGSVNGYNAVLQIGANTGQSFTIQIDDMRALALGISTKDNTVAKTVNVDGKDYTVAWTKNMDVTNGTDAQGAEYALDVSTHDNATAAIKVIDDAITTVSAERSKLGAYQNRLEHTISNLGTSAENLQAAESRIRDLDMAEEIMAFTKNNILQQAATAMLAQANMAPQSVLQLLG
jgi:flagellin